MNKKSKIYHTEQKRTQIGKLGTLTTCITEGEDGTSELHQVLTFVGQNGNVHEITSATGELLFGSPEDLSALETLVVWISEKSIRNT